MSLDALKIEVPGPDDITEADVIRHNVLMHQLPGYYGSQEHKQFVEKVERAATKK